MYAWQPFICYPMGLCESLDDTALSHDMYLCQGDTGVVSIEWCQNAQKRCSLGRTIIIHLTLRNPNLTFFLSCGNNVCFMHQSKVASLDRFELSIALQPVSVVAQYAWPTLKSFNIQRPICHLGRDSGKRRWVVRVGAKEEAYRRQDWWISGRSKMEP